MDVDTSEQTYAESGPSLLSLPDHVLTLIIDHLYGWSLRQVRLTCKPLACLVLRRIKSFDANDHVLNNSTPQTPEAFEPLGEWLLGCPPRCTELETLHLRFTHAQDFTRVASVMRSVLTSCGHQLQSLTWHHFTSQLTPEAWSAFLESCPSSITALSLPYHLWPEHDTPDNHGQMSSHAQQHAAHAPPHAGAAGSVSSEYIFDWAPLCQLLAKLPKLSSLELTGMVHLNHPDELMVLGSLEQLTALQGVAARVTGLTSLTRLTQLQRLELLLEDFRTLENGEAAFSVSSEVDTLLTHLTSLTHLDIFGYVGDAMPLLQSLGPLHHLRHLAMFFLADVAYLTDSHLVELAHLTQLTHLGVDRLDISYEDSCLPHLRSLDVGLSIYSMPRLSTVFPCVENVKLRWLWEQAIRKLAGWQSVRTLDLSNLQYCLDWRLLRTLQAVAVLHLGYGQGYSLLGEVLGVLQGLPHLRELSLSNWSSGSSAGGFPDQPEPSRSGSSSSSSNSAGADPSPEVLLAMSSLEHLTGLHTLELNCCPHEMVLAVAGLQLAGLRHLRLVMMHELMMQDVGALLSGPLPNIQQLLIKGCSEITQNDISFLMQRHPALELQWVMYKT